MPVNSDSFHLQNWFNSIWIKKATLTDTSCSFALFQSFNVVTYGLERKFSNSHEVFICITVFIIHQ